MITPTHEAYKKMLKGEITTQEYLDVVDAYVEAQRREFGLYRQRYVIGIGKQEEPFEWKTYVVCGFAVVGFFDTAIHTVQAIVGWVS